MSRSTKLYLEYSLMDMSMIFGDDIAPEVYMLKTCVSLPKMFRNSCIMKTFSLPVDSIGEFIM